MKAIITGGGSEETIPRCPYLMLKQNKAKEGERWHPNCARWMWVNALCVFSKGSGERQGVEPRQCAESERNYDQSERRGTSPNAGGMGLSQLCRQVGLEQSGLGRGAPGVQLLWVAPASQFPRSAQRQLPFSPPAEKQTPRPRYSKGGRVCQPPTASSSGLGRWQEVWILTSRSQALCPFLSKCLPPWAPWARRARGKTFQG